MICERHSRSNCFFSRILVTLTRLNFAHVLSIVTPVRTKSFERIQWFLYVLRNDEFKINSAFQLQGTKRSVVYFKTIENNSKAEIHQENVMNLRKCKGMCDVYTLSWGQSLSHYYWHATRDGSMLFTRSRWDNNTLCIITSHDAENLLALVFSTTHRRTWNKSHGSGTQFPYSAWGGWDWRTRVDSQ